MIMHAGEAKEGSSQGVLDQPASIGGKLKARHRLCLKSLSEEHPKLTPGLSIHVSQIDMYPPHTYMHAHIHTHTPHTQMVTRIRLALK